MSVLAALTPPFLVCAVVIAAIVAFLRHEVGRGRKDRGARREDNSVLGSPADDERDGAAGSNADAGTSARRDG